MAKTVREIIETMNEEQRNALYALVGTAMEGDTEDLSQSDFDDEDEDDLEHSDFDPEEEIAAIFKDAKREGSLKEAFLAHAQNYGIEEIQELFPAEHVLMTKPTFLNNNTEWVNKILGPITKLPFTRVKTLFADLTVETIRAKGYVKGTLKEEDVFALIKRVTEPYTIYKKGKLDRDDMIDITDFEMVAWLKEVMRMKLDEELARTILIGDGRTPEDPYKIDEECIRPIFNDSELYTIKAPIDPTNENKAKAFIDSVIKSRKDYRGSGSPSLFMTDDLLADILLLEDSDGRKLYTSMEEIKNLLRVKEIVTMNEMSGLKRTDKETDAITNVLGIIVNLKDYSIGTDKGGSVAMFDDFDIDYNQQKFLIETRCSGALTIPYSAIVIEEATA